MSPTSGLLELARRLAREQWGVDEPEATALPGHRDDNVRISDRAGNRYVLKLSAPGTDPAFLAFETAAMVRVARALGGPDPAPRHGGGATRESRNGPITPEPLPARDGGYVVEADAPGGATRRARLLTWVPGEDAAGVRPRSLALGESTGRALARIDRVLEGSDAPAAHRELEWDLARGLQVVAAYVEAVPDPDRRALLGRVADRVDRVLRPRAALLRRTVIHGDGNDHNLKVAPPSHDLLAPRRVTGVVDFGDLHFGWRIAEPAVAAAYALLGSVEPVESVAAVARGYHAVTELEEIELEVLQPLVCLRLAVSVVLSARARLDRADNDYLFVSEARAWEALERLETVHPSYAHYRIRAACGLEPCPSAPTTIAWLESHADEIGPVLDPDPRAVRRQPLDLSVGSLEVAELGGRGDDPHAWTEVLFGRMADAGAAVGIGCWNESRRWYTGDLYRVETDEGPRWRTLHTGVDLFAEAGTPVRAPLPGTVHSARDNGGPQDYGPTVVLEHEVDVPGARDAGGGPLVFHTLYGHLSRDSLDGVEPGRAVERGEVIGRLGHEHENGGWAPHLHLQIVTDMLGRTGDFPGVARPDHRALWTSLSPDPNLLLRLPEGCTAPPPSRPEELEARRRDHLAPNLSLSYREPLHIVRGWMQHLYDVDGQAYLDCVNNVAHVGHSHPRVVEALRRQAAVLNTNSRYLHQRILDYAERLADLFPDPLSVVYLVNSGSEANELALRLARTHTGRRDVVVLDGAYHGNTGSLVDMSPYKFGGPGGEGRPDWVQVAPMPDPYRGRFRVRNPDAVRGVEARAGSAAGEDTTPSAPSREPAGVVGNDDVAGAYAAEIAEACRRSLETGTGPAAFFAEPILSCGGQIEPPAGYLAEAYRHAREAGAVCVADEVQVGLGRVGEHWWGFQTQGPDVVPDIVTLGKPVGNGHPLGAVVTTPRIARSFDTGMEYFNTFGGNPVSCAVGSAVLDVMEEEGLRERARTVGGALRAGLEEVAGRHPLVGDVRGRGLFLGVELVLDRDERTPAPAQAHYVVERAREQGVLLSTDGPDHDVIKIKPPLQFGAEDAERLVEVLDGVLGEDPVRT